MVVDDESSMRACGGCGEPMPIERSVCAACGQLQGPDPTVPRAPVASDATTWSSAPPVPGTGGFGGGFVRQPVSVGSWEAPAHAPQPSRKKRGPWAAVLAAAVVVATVTAAAVVLQGGSDLLPEAAPTTTTPRNAWHGQLNRYCEQPGQAWPEVPRYVPGEPARTYAHFEPGGVSNGSEDKNYLDQVPVYLGALAVSPTTAGARFSSEASEIHDIRSVTCIDFIETVPLGRRCPYHVLDATRPSLSPPQVELDSAYNRYRIAVYELHSGKVLTEGEIDSRNDACPRFVPNPDETVGYWLTGQQVLDWMHTHFVDGKPV